MKKLYQIALVGNPNSGKSSLFNSLTGLHQKVGNFPGVTVDKKTGVARIHGDLQARILDLPGTYSLYPKSEDERISCSLLLNPQGEDRPDMVVVIADAANLKRNLLFCSQIMDLNYPVIIALTMNDIARQKGISIDVEGLERQMGVPVVPINPRKNKGMAELKKVMADLRQLPRPRDRKPFVDMEVLSSPWVEKIKDRLGLDSAYAAFHVACHAEDLDFLDSDQKAEIRQWVDAAPFSKSRIQGEEVLKRYERISQIMKQTVVEDSPLRRALFSEKLDKWLLHPLWGNLVLFLVLFFMFQSIFWLAEYPMAWVEALFQQGSMALDQWLPDSLFKDLLINGVMAGLGGIAMFIPQIMILFGFINILEDSGYMARISFLSDRLMRSVGLNGRSVMPLISGMACAVPAVMAARSIQNPKERLITILVTPLMSCAARLPVYTILIGLVIPDRSYGIINLQGMVLMGLYLLGFVSALLVSWVMDKIIRSRERSHYLMELPVYRPPRWRNVVITMIEKARIFVLEAGKVILVISIALWVLSSYGPPGRLDQVEVEFAAMKERGEWDEEQSPRDLQTARLENSYAGIMGHMLEPVIRPLGFDWKIGIALVTSFAAREVFVGTMATLYSLDDDSSDKTIREKMRAARHADGSPVYTLGSGVALLLFYVFAMQCMSTMAIVRKETRTWKIPLIQFAYMLILAYGTAWLAYQLL